VPERDDLFESIRSCCINGEPAAGSEELIWQRHGRECAVMVLDSSGFTRITKTRGIIHYLSCIIRLRDFLIDIFRKKECISCRFHADNAYAEFLTAEDALEAAVSIQRTLPLEKIELCRGCLFSVCIGIGYGKMLESAGEGMYGHEMNLASKLGEDIAGSGDILLTPAAFEAVPKSRRTDFTEKRSHISGVEVRYYARRKDGVE